jgi:hypothetical protein
LTQTITSILESRDEQTELLRQLVANSARGFNGGRNAPAPATITYGDFAATHTLLFIKAGESLETDHWLWVMEAKFGLLRCTEVQKTLFATQQLRGDVSACVCVELLSNYPEDYCVVKITFSRGLLYTITRPGQQCSFFSVAFVCQC